MHPLCGVCTIFQRATQRPRILLHDNIESGACCSVNYYSNYNFFQFKFCTFSVTCKSCHLHTCSFHFPFGDGQLSKDLKISLSFNSEKLQDVKNISYIFPKQIPLFKADDPELLTITRPISLQFMRVLKRVMKNRPHYPTTVSSLRSVSDYGGTSL